MLLLQHFTKQCTKCKIIKYKNEFSRDKYRNDNLSCHCKKCVRNYQQENRDIIIERSKKHHADNRDAYYEYQRKYQQENKPHLLIPPEILKERNRENYLKNRERNIKTSKEYILRNKESYKTYQKKYRKTLNAKYSSRNSANKRRAKEKIGDVSTQDIMLLQENAKVCYWCKCSLKNVKVHIDHYVPLAKGGHHTLNNLVVSCQPCNNKKHAKDPIEFANSIGRLL